MPSEIYEELGREQFSQILKENKRAIVIKFTASWCKPCKSIKANIDKIFGELPEDVLCFDLDIDDNFDLYAFMKSKKMVTGIPVLLGYKKGNVHFAPDHSISGTDLSQIQAFFQNCLT